MRSFLFLFGFILSIQVYGQKINGLSFVASRDSITSEHVNPVINVNANYVSLMPFAFTRGLHSPNITFRYKRRWFGEKERGVAQYAQEFHKRGVKVMVKPQIWVSRGEFTGHIEMKNEEDWKILEETYQDYILAYATVAKEINADIFCIGTELEKFVSQRPEYWEKLILEIRKIFKGKLTYAANWDEFKRVTFWDQIDYIGVDAYFPIVDKKTPSVADFEKGWQPHKQQIQQVYKRFKKPVLFTEFGYRSIDYTGKEPWDANRVDGLVNTQAQSNGLQAIYNQFWSEDWFAGGFVWKWFHRHDRVGGEKNNRFTPQNKPAELLLKKLYKSR